MKNEEQLIEDQSLKSNYKNNGWINEGLLELLFEAKNQISEMISAGGLLSAVSFFFISLYKNHLINFPLHESSASHQAPKIQIIGCCWFFFFVTQDNSDVNASLTQNACERVI